MIVSAVSSASSPRSIRRARPSVRTSADSAHRPTRKGLLSSGSRAQSNACMGAAMSNGTTSSRTRIATECMRATIGAFPPVLQKPSAGLG
ncbi:hypothetical protein STENM327S_07359 [Streptomyces tendae]